MLSRPSVFLLCFCLFHGTLAWSQGIDSIHLMLKEAHRLEDSFRKDSALSYYYSYLAEAYSGQQDTLSLQFIDSLETLLPDSRWNKTEGLLFRARGKYHDRRGEFEQALGQYTEAIASLEKNGDQSELVAYAYILKAFVLNNNGMTEACYATLEKIRPGRTVWPIKTTSPGYSIVMETINFIQPMATRFPGCTFLLPAGGDIAASGKEHDDQSGQCAWPGRLLPTIR